jgi:hypothetical protein
MGKYADHYHIEYKDTIRLHFDKKVETAWLTLKNYGVVFGAPSRSKLTKDVRVVTVGTPAVERYTDTISIGQMLDATDVIKLQVGILDIVKDFVATSFQCNDLLDVIALALSELEPKPRVQQSTDHQERPGARGSEVAGWDVLRRSSSAFL